MTATFGSSSRFMRFAPRLGFPPCSSYRLSHKYLNGRLHGDVLSAERVFCPPIFASLSSSGPEPLMTGAINPLFKDIRADTLSYVTTYPGESCDFRSKHCRGGATVFFGTAGWVPDALGTAPLSLDTNGKRRAFAQPYVKLGPEPSPEALTLVFQELSTFLGPEGAREVRATCS